VGANKLLRNAFSVLQPLSATPQIAIPYSALQGNSISRIGNSFTLRIVYESRTHHTPQLGFQLLEK
jgi:hypothetical protein